MDVNDSGGDNANHSIGSVQVVADSGSDNTTGDNTTGDNTNNGSYTYQNYNRAANKDGTGNATTGDNDERIFVFPNATVFKGEEDIQFAGTLHRSLTGVSGNAEGTQLSPPVSQDQAEGLYSNDGQPGSKYVSVNTPRITHFKIHPTDSMDQDIGGSSIPESAADNLTVVADWNFKQAENLEIEVDNANGLDITDEVLTTKPHHLSGTDNTGADQMSEANADDDGRVSWTLDLSDQDAGDYSINVAGTDELSFGAATQTKTLTLSSQDQISLDLDSDSVTQGDKVTYTIRGSSAGNQHVVTIDGNDLRDGVTASQARKALRNTGDVDDVGIVTNDGDVYSGSDDVSNVSRDDIDYVYANLTIDDDTGVAVGSIDAQYLDDTSVEVDVYQAGDDISTVAASDASEEDSPTLEVNEGEITITNPTNTYVTGSQVEVNGTAPSGLDDIAVYARDQGEYKLVDLDGNTDNGIQATTSVKSDGTWSEDDVVLSHGDAPGNDIFRIKGTFRLGAIDVQDVPQSDDYDGPAKSISVSDFNSGTSGQKSIRVTGTSLTATFQTVNGQVASDADGTLDVNGTAPGADDVLLGFVDERGNVQYRTASVDDDDYTFDADDVAVSDLTQGTVHAFAYHIGQDGYVGDGDLASQDGDATGLRAMQGYLDYLNDRSLDGSQVINSIESETVNDTASDDNMAETTFRLTDASTRINTAYTEDHEASGINPLGVGTTAMVSGQTNLQPDDNTITVELQNDNGDTLSLTSTDSWDYDGQWSTELPVDSDVSPGNYTLHLDDGENTDTVDVQVVSADELPTTSTSTSTSMSTSTSTSMSTSTSTTSTTTSTSTSSSSSTSGTSSPGFGVGLALVALAGAALLALRREN
ncbi:HVO_2072 family ArtA-dependent S-layer glycoprotein [Halarchaeum acidiphilum]|uniref:HVO_2072 family ArtA-dependent S-layer glycoprotein n=2 Tax=Halarchaeum acidiphilum TaxID=489138 RepID=UPI0006778C73|nr:HVO_2072 family ArtA-dependent S-layer glycoprotein [Halarchaeum acidiphilum]